MLTKEQKRKEGAYFTPEELVYDVLWKTAFYIPDNNIPKKILEPSCGNGAFISVLKDVFPDSKIIGIEKNKEFFRECSKKYSCENVKIINGDFLKSSFLKTSFDESFDLIVGNPPYYVHKNRLYNEFFTGRPNIFIQFLIHSLKQLSKNGILAFIIPETFLNCVYYEPARRFIKENFEILVIEKNPDMFIDTKYPTITFICRRSEHTFNNDSWCYSDVFIYDDCLKELLKKPHFKLNSFGDSLKIFVGDFVWNEHKGLISETYIEGSPVCLCSGNRKVKFLKNCPKKYVRNQSCIIVSRGYGNKYSFEFSKISPTDYPQGYVLENHLLAISGEDELLERVLKGFENDDTKRFIEKYVTNGALTINDLKNNICVFSLQ